MRWVTDWLEYWLLSMKSVGFYLMMFLYANLCRLKNLMTLSSGMHFLGHTFVYESDIMVFEICVLFSPSPWIYFVLPSYYRWGNMIRSGTHRRVLRVVSLTLGIGVTAAAEVVAEVTAGAGAGAGGIDVFNAKLKLLLRCFSILIIELECSKSPKAKSSRRSPAKSGSRSRSRSRSASRSPSPSGYVQHCLFVCLSLMSVN